MELCVVGGQIPEPKPATFELRVADFVSEACGIDPKSYFVTSGDAIAKARVLRRHFEERSGECFEAAAAAYATGRMIEALIAVRGSATFLETEWHNHMLLCMPKNPRSKRETFEVL